MSHRPHPIREVWLGTPYHDPDDAVLYDDCARCAEHADNLTSLDPEKIGAVWRRMVEVEKAPRHLPSAHYRTETEAVACRNLYRIAVIVESSHPLVDPWSWPWRTRSALAAGGALGGVRP